MTLPHQSLTHVMLQDSCGFRAQTIFENQYRLSKSMVLGVKDIHKKTWDCFQRVLGRLWKPESTTLIETQPKLALGIVYNFEQAPLRSLIETSLGASRMACKWLHTIEGSLQFSWHVCSLSLDIQNFTIRRLPSSLRAQKHYRIRLQEQN